MTENIRPQPEVYRIYLEQCSQEELLELYSDEILVGSCTSGVETAMVEYISRVVEPVGWKAVWRATKLSSGLVSECDFLVEVFDVSLEKLQATVTVLELLDCPEVEQVQASSELEILMNTNLTPELCVPIIELYPLSEGDEEEAFLKTAVAIEHVRCFYKYLWRPWDEDDDDDIFAEKYLSHRIKFFLDLKKKVIPESLAVQAETILQEGSKLWDELNSITKEMQISDSEQELDEEDVSKVIQLRLKLEELQKQMEMMENPFVRTFALTKDVSAKAKNTSYVGPVFHIVGESFTFGRMKALELNENDMLEFHHNPEDAIGSASSGDTVLILPGSYKCGAFKWLENNITIRGLGSNAEEVVLKGLSGTGDFFLNCSSDLIQLENVTLHPTKDTKATLMIHTGKLIMNNCTVYGGLSCLVLLPSAKAEVTSSEISNAKVDGIQLRQGSSLLLNTCKILYCKNSGIFINSPTVHWREELGCTKLTVIDTKISPRGYEYDVVLECLPNQDFIKNLSLYHDDFTWNEIKKVPWLNFSITGQCELGALGLQYLKEIKGSPLSPPKNYSSFEDSVDINHFHWSDDNLSETVKAFHFEDSNDDEIAKNISVSI